MNFETSHPACGYRGLTPLSKNFREFLLVGKDPTEGSAIEITPYTRDDRHYRISEPNSPSVTRVRIFIFGPTAVMVRMILPRSITVMLWAPRNVASGLSTLPVLTCGKRTLPVRQFGRATV